MPKPSASIELRRRRSASSSSKAIGDSQGARFAAGSESEIVATSDGPRWPRTRPRCRRSMSTSTPTRSSSTSATGTIDLRLGMLRPHRRDDLMTKVAPVEFDAGAQCPRFDRFLSEVMRGDAELVHFQYRHLGYALTGSAREHMLAFWWGKGGNGKGVLGAIMLHVVFGDYAAKAAPDLLFRGEKTERHPTELADLHGRRLVICNETTRGRSWDEGTLKDITGGDRIRRTPHCARTSGSTTRHTRSSSGATGSRPTSYPSSTMRCAAGCASCPFCSRSSAGRTGGSPSSCWRRRPASSRSS